MHAQRYARQLILPGFGAAAQARLVEARVLIVGAGALGTPLAQYLAGAGVGTLTLVDADAVAETNLHRQLLYTPADVGQLKVEVLAARLRAQNPSIAVQAVAEMLRPSNADALIGSHAVVCDGSDDFACRYLVNDRAVRLGRPVVSASVYQWEGQLTVLNHPVGVGPNLRDLFATPAAEADNCETGGVMGALPGALGALMALEAIKLITGMGEPLSGRLLLLDGLTLTTRVLSYAADPSNPLRDPAWTPPASDYAPRCAPAVAENGAASADALSPEALAELLARAAVTLIDVRSASEHAAFHIGGLHIPLGQLPQALSEGQIPEDHLLVAYCATGVRSRTALVLLRQAGLNAQHLAGGIAAWQAAGRPAAASA